VARTNVANFDMVQSIIICHIKFVYHLRGRLTVEGLMTHNRTDIATNLVSRWIKLYQLSGVYEQYNAITGAPYGVVGLGMSTLIVDAMYRLGVL
jgi:hypothetical protein